MAEDKSRLHHDITLTVMVSGTVCSIMGIATNLLGITDIPWWVLAIIGTMPYIYHVMWVSKA